LPRRRSAAVNGVAKQQVAAPLAGTEFAAYFPFIVILRGFMSVGSIASSLVSPPAIGNAAAGGANGDTGFSSQLAQLLGSHKHHHHAMQAGGADRSGVSSAPQAGGSSSSDFAQMLQQLQGEGDAESALSEALPITA
jgi:hypothetical protein